MKEFRFVLHHENHFISLKRYRLHCLCLFRLPLAVKSREENLKGGPLAGCALYLDKTIVLLDDTENGGQTQARPVSLRLGSEKRFVDVGQSRPVHPRSGVGNTQEYVFSRRHVPIQIAMEGMEGMVCGGDGNGADIGYGIPAVGA